MHVLEGITRAAGGNGYAYAARDQRKDSRGALHEFLNVIRAGEHALDLAFLLLRHPRLTRQLLNVIAVGISRWDASGRGVRLIEITCVSKFSHHVANRGGAPLLCARLRDRL